MAGTPQLSVVVPVHDEARNIAPLVREVVAALRGGVAFELIYVDDASRDATAAELQALRGEVPELRVLRHATRAGQSLAIRNGVKAARAAWVATLDGDGQNDPADLPKLLAAASRAANAIRRRLLRDDTPDTGCGTKLFEREAFLELPYFDHMHRYLPALVQRAGWQTLSLPVNHRARSSGSSKYDNLSRAIVGLRDLRGVAWLIRRSQVVRVEELP